MHGIKAWKVVVFLFLTFVVLRCCYTQAKDKEANQRPAQTDSRSRVVDKLPTTFAPRMFYLTIGSTQVPCTGLTVKYEDDSEWVWQGKCSENGSWEEVMKALGAEIDKTQREKARILKTRGK